ncbi:MAG: type II toxin-antitoxin system RelE/ParE family toxin [Chitinophagaceae bacterium]|nr:type II toxin-antitoxin system RelE/ParE family toxin [Chitinophagaceae bacterium]
MNLKIDESFEKDLRKLRSKPLNLKVASIIREVMAAQNIGEINHIKQLKGSGVHFRIRVGDYRIGLIYTRSAVIFVRILHRKEIYRFFP